MEDAHPTENSSEQKPRSKKTTKWQTVTVVIVLSAFVLGGIIFSEWRETLFAGSAPSNLIAVLPFENINRDGYAENIANNLTESVMSEIAQNSTYRVVPRSEVMRYKGKNENAGGAGQALKARMVLTGRVLREGDNLTVKAELVEVENRSSIWTKQYNIPISEVRDLPGDIAREVIAAASNHK